MGNTDLNSIDKLALSVGRQKSQQQSTTTPRAGQYVRIGDRDEVFLVLRVDKTRHLADLLRQGAVHKVQAGVPLALLSVVDTSASRAEESSEDAQLSEQAS